MVPLSDLFTFNSYNEDTSLPEGERKTQVDTEPCHKDNSQMTSAFYRTFIDQAVCLVGKHAEIYGSPSFQEGA